MYFSNCHTADQCKAQYRELAKRLHPDKQGGSSAAFQKMQEEYEGRLRELMNEQPRQNTIEYTRLANAFLEILKSTKPEYYELVKVFGNHEKVKAVTQLLNAFFPEKANTVNEILNLLQ
jgi:curved DNA-binding protein CbpA